MCDWCDNIHTTSRKCTLCAVLVVEPEYGQNPKSTYRLLISFMCECRYPSPDESLAIRLLRSLQSSIIQIRFIAEFIALLFGKVYHWFVNFFVASKRFNQILFDDGNSIEMITARSTRK